jgi:pimeloyl-ACP methyl ester carboxylesterase
MAGSLTPRSAVRKGKGAGLPRRALISVLAVLVMAALLVAGKVAANAAPGPCAAIAALEPQTGHNMPPAAPSLFASDFPALTDCEWGYQLGGWGGSHAGTALQRTPVIFVHGNQADAENWFLVADQLKQQAGYTDQELYALSYNGLENQSAGLPSCCVPAPESQTYWQANPTVFANGGKGASDDPNVPDLYAFIQAVEQYTGSQDVDLVAHSLGVTIVRKLLVVHPELRQHVLAGVMIAGANHGTTVCRGLDTSYYGCDEIAPGTSWLQQLNAAGEAVGPTHWMSVYNGTDNTDPFFQAAPGVFDDTRSPHLDGAVNVTCPTTYHNDLRVRPDIVQIYLQFLLQYGQSGGPIQVTLPAGTQPQIPCSVAQPAADIPEVPALPLLPLAAIAVVAGGRRLVTRGRRLRDDRGC